jgi:hypothetical protein
MLNVATLWTVCYMYLTLHFSQSLRQQGTFQDMRAAGAPVRGNAPQPQLHSRAQQLAFQRELDRLAQQTDAVRTVSF